MFLLLIFYSVMQWVCTVEAKKCVFYGLVYIVDCEMCQTRGIFVCFISMCMFCLSYCL
jgi:hypothetical protein